MAVHNGPEAGAAALALAHALTVAALHSGAVSFGALAAVLAQMEGTLRTDGLNDAADFLAGVRNGAWEQMRSPE